MAQLAKASVRGGKRTSAWARHAAWPNGRDEGSCEREKSLSAY